MTVYTGSKTASLQAVWGTATDATVAVDAPRGKTMTKEKKKTAKIWGALLAAAAVVCGITLLGPADEKSPPPDQPQPQAATDDATIVIDSFHQTSTRDGSREWSLDAQSAVLDSAGKEAEFEKLAITFYLEGGDEVYLTADRGTLQMESKDMVVSGNVVVTNDDFILKTNRLFYNNQEQLFSSKDPVRIDSGESRLDADTLVYNLATNITEFTGRVRGTFGDAVVL